MKTLLFVTSTILVSLFSQAQSSFDNYEIGHYVDINKRIIDGFFDLNYNPELSLKVSYTVGNSYTSDYYYNLKGEKIIGMIKNSSTSTKYFLFRKSFKGNYSQIKTSNCLGYVVGKDSFAVLNNYENQVQMGIDKNGEFAEVMECFENMTFYKYRIQYAQDFAINYLVKTDTSNKIFRFPDNKKRFKPFAIKVFGELQSLKNEIQNDKYSDKDIPTMVKMLKYKKLSDDNKNIYFNSAWDEVENYSECSYYATIDYKMDSIIYLKFFFKDNTLIFEGGFSSLYPHIKEGKFIWYYLNGKKRRTIIYKNNIPAKLFTYFDNENLHTEYRILRNKDIYYLKVLNKTGKNVLDTTASGINRVYDHINNRELMMEYRNHVLVSIYYNDDNGEKIHQLSENDFNTKIIDKLNQKIKGNIKYPEKSIKEFNHGYVLIKCIIKSGEPKNFDIVKGIDPECDSLILNYLTSDNISNIWKKINKKNVNLNQEIVIPVEFTINGYSGYKSNPIFNNWLFFNNYFDYHLHLPKTPKLPQVKFPSTINY